MRLYSALLRKTQSALQRQNENQTNMTQRLKTKDTLQDSLKYYTNKLTEIKSYNSK